MNSLAEVHTGCAKVQHCYEGDQSLQREMTNFELSVCQLICKHQSKQMSAYQQYLWKY